MADPYGRGVVMRNQTNRTCPVCGLTLHRISDDTAVCSHCFRDFQILEGVPFRSEQGTTNSDKADTLKKMKPFIIPGIAISFATGLFPLGVMLIVMLSTLNKQEKADPAEEKPTHTNLSNSKVPKTRADYLCAFHALPRITMPLGIYADRAIRQINRLEQKQQALSTMLGKDHPFIRNGNEAEAYILKNCRQMLYRLEFCDQSSPEFCRIHAEFLEEKLAENETVLYDFEKLVIEVTQLDLDSQETPPCLDVLAETLHNVRTLDGTLPQYSYPDTLAAQRFMQG